MHRLHAISLVLFMLLAPAPAPCGVLTNRLSSGYAAGGAPASLPVIVWFDKQVDLAPFDKGRETAPDLIRALQANAAESQSPVTTLLDAEAKSGARVLWIANALALDADEPLARRLAESPGVARVDLDAPDLQTVGSPVGGPVAAATNWNLDLIGVPTVWSTYHLSGQGVVIGSMDTGFDPAHPALAGHWRGGSNSWKDCIGSSSTPYDDHGHGTHTIGTMVGGDGPGTFANDIGVAYGARFISAKILGADGSGTSTSFLVGAQWMLDPDGNPSTNDFPDVINNSWAFQQSDYAGFQNATAAWRAAGIIPVFAIGNAGPGSATTRAPGNYADVIGVGATTASDAIASFSSRGPSPSGSGFPANQRKPDLSAPGNLIVSSIPGGGYQAWNGTSMAAPHVAGTIALLLQACPAYNYDDVRNKLINHAVDLGLTGYDFDFGYGRLDALASIDAALPGPITLLAPADGATEQPLNGLLDWADSPRATSYRLEIDCTGGEAYLSTSTTASQYAYSLPPGTYRWHVTPRNACSTAGVPSTERSFTVAGGATCVSVTPLDPANGADCRPEDVTLRWAPIAGAYGYVVRVRTGSHSGPNDCRNGTEYQVTDNSLALTRLGYDQTVVWSVRENCPCATFSDCMSFRTMTDPGRVHPPGLSSPSDGASRQPLSGVLTWGSRPDAVGYRVQLGTACGQGDSADVATTSWAYSGLAQNTVYSWRVAMIDSCGTVSSYSSCRTFTTEQITGLTRLYVPAGVTARRGQVGFALPVGGENLEKLQRVSFRLRYDPAVLHYTAFSVAGTRGAGATTVSVAPAGSDRVQVDLTWPGGGACTEVLPTGDGTLIRLLFDVATSATIGATAVDPGNSGVQFQRCPGGNSPVTDQPGTIQILDATAGVGDEVPAGLMLLAPAPNPAREGATLRFAIPRGGAYELGIFDLAGHQVSNLSRGDVGPGWHAVRWDARSGGDRIPPGLYWIRLRTSDGARCTRVTIVR